MRKSNKVHGKSCEFGTKNPRAQVASIAVHDVGSLGDVSMLNHVEPIMELNRCSLKGSHNCKMEHHHSNVPIDGLFSSYLPANFKKNRK